MGANCSVSKAEAEASAVFRKNLEIPGLNTSKFEDEYIIGSVLAPKVIEVKNKITKNTSVVYKLEKSTIPCGDPEAIGALVKRLQTIDHPHIAHLVEGFDDPQYTYLVFGQVLGGVLFDQVGKSGHMSEHKAAEVMRQAVKALVGAAHFNITHGALSPKNFLINNTGRCILTDFGLADTLKPSPLHKLTKESFCYLAPEVLKPWMDKQDMTAKHPKAKKVELSEIEVKAKTTASDIWSLGVVLYQLLSGKAPFKGKCVLDLAQNVLDVPDQIPWLNTMKGLSQSTKELIQSMLQKDPSKRPTADELLAHTWLLEKTKHSETPLDQDIASNLKSFQAETHFKKFMMELISTKIPHKKMKEFENSFNAMDTNNDGFVTMDELKAGVEKGLTGSEAKDMEQVFKDIDSDGSGVISIREFIACTVDAQKGLVTGLLHDSFKALDTNKDGCITRDEIERMVHEVDGRLGAAHIEVMMEAIENEVGDSISFERFCSLVTGEGGAGTVSPAMMCCTKVKRGVRHVIACEPCKKTAS